MKTINKLLTASLVSMMFAGAASADSIYLNLGQEYSGSGQTVTGWFDELDFSYESNTVVTDEDTSFDGLNPDSFLSVGDTTVTNVGMALGQTYDNYLNTRVNNLDGITAVDDFNGFFSGLANWGITFGITDLQGVVTGVGPGGVALAYQSATIEMFMYDFSDTAGDISSALTHIFDLDISFGGDTGNATVLKGKIANVQNTSFNGIAAKDIFNIASGSGELTFGAASELAGGLRFLVSNDTEQAGPLALNGQGQLLIAGEHDGSIEFSVPEPTSLAILGLGLLGFAGSRRRKA